MKTIENNKLITEFMGYYKYAWIGHTMYIFEDDNHRAEVDLHYHSDWNWLMPVVEKIESLGYKVDISKWENSQYCGIYLNGKKIAGNETNTKIEAVYNACIEFIKWYITQNK